MNQFLMGLGIYLLLGLIYVCVGWKRIEQIGRATVGERMMIGIPIILLFWPLLSILALIDHLRIMRSVSKANRGKPLCECGALVRITAEHMRGLRDDGHSRVKCAECGGATPLTAEKSS